LGLPCKNHPDGQGCCLPKAGEVDVLDVSGPCQPFTNMTRSGFSKTPQEHRSYNTTFGESGSVCSVVQAVLPKIFISEQVLGFAKPFVKDEPQTSPKAEFISKIMGTVNSQGNHHFENCMAINLDSKEFIDCNRPRFPGPCIRILVCVAPLARFNYTTIHLDVVVFSREPSSVN
jgi:hypothetical protein